MFRTLLGDHTEPSVSISSLLNKTEKMSPTENTETLTVREAITVQETATRDNDSAERDSTPQRSIAAASPARRSAFKLSQKEPEPEPAVEAEPARPSEEQEKDAAEPATDAANEEVVPEKPQPTKGAREAVNGDDSAAETNASTNTNTNTRSTKSRAPKERAEPAAKKVEKADKEDDAAPKPATSSEENVFEIDRLATHRVNKDTSTVDFFVEWVGTATSWEPERELQSQVPDLVFEYWDAQGGREKATGLEEFHVFRILDSAVDPPSYRVQWVGYRDTPADTTWESRALLRRVAPIALGLYDSTNKKRTAKGRPGRPSKKAKTARSADR